MTDITQTPYNASSSDNSPSIPDSFVTLALLFILIFGSYIYVFHADPWDNALNRLDLAYSVVYHHSLNIDPYYHNTVDRALYQGHRYSSEAIGGVIPAAAILVLYRRVTGDNNPDPFNPIPLYLITILIVSLPSALLSVLLFRWLGRISTNLVDRVAVTLAFAFGTLVFPYSTMYYSYMPALLLCFTAFLLIERGPTPLSAPAIGFLLSYAFITSYDAFLISGPMTVYFLATIFSPSGKSDGNSSRAKTEDVRQRWLTIVLFVLGALPPVILLMVYNAACFGGPFNLGLFHSEAKEFSGNRDIMGSFFTSKPAHLWGLTLRPGVGIFWISPLLLIGLSGCVRMLQQSNLRRRGILFLAIPILFLLCNSAFPLWRGGAGPGPRYLTASLLFLCAPAVFALQRRPALRPLFVTLAFASFALMGVSTLTGPHAPSAVHSPIHAYNVPLLLHGYTSWNFGFPLGLMGAASAIPWVALVIAVTLFFVSINRSRIQSESQPRAFSATRWLVAVALAVAFLAAGRALSDVHSFGAAMLRANYLMQKHFYVAATQEYTLAVRLRPHNLEALAQRARLRYLQNDLSGSLADFLRIQRLHPNVSFAPYNAAQIFEKLGNKKESEKELDRLLLMRTVPRHIAFEAHLSRGSIRMDRGDIAGAVADFTSAARREPENPQPLIIEAGSRILLFNRTQDSANLKIAADLLAKALTLDPTNAVAHRLLNGISKSGN